MPVLQKSKQQPTYRWDRKRVCYVDEAGRPVPQQKVRAWMLALAIAARYQLKDLGDKLQTGEMKKPEWFALTAQTMKRVHTVGAVLAAGGADSFLAAMEEEESDLLDALEAREEFQFERLEAFAGEIPEDPEERDGTIGARSAMYGMAALTTFVNIGRAVVLDRVEELAGGGAGGGGPFAGEDVEIIERRNLNSHVPCEDCDMYAAMGWQPLGTLPELGDSICMSNCQCDFEYRMEGRMRDEDFDEDEIPMILQMPMVGNYVVDPSALPLDGPARVDSPRKSWQ